jgi:alpha-galactosidase
MDRINASSRENEMANRLAESFTEECTRATPPFSLIYDGNPSSGFFSEWSRESSIEQTDECSETHTISYSDSATGLKIRAEMIRYKDFPAVEWVLYFKNTGCSDTPILEDIRALDLSIPGGREQECLLRYAKGSSCGPEDFAPQKKVFTEWDNSLRLAPHGGRSSNGILPFFNLSQGKQGVIVAVGWSGQWSADFSRDGSGSMRVQAGLELTHFKLQPGEEIRSPRILTLFWEDDWLRAQNLLRRFLLKHHRPLVNGRPCTPPLSNMNWGGTTTDVHLDNIRKMVQHDLVFDHYWIDAGWHGEPWPDHVGTWEPCSTRYPDGFTPISNAVHQCKHRLLLWFETERVVRDTIWHGAHKDWLLGAGTGENRSKSGLMDLGNIETREFLTDFISGKIIEFGLDCYRQDFNIDPLEYWRRADAPDRQGITESKYIEGLYLFWDELLRRHPHLLIDNCSSGGRRIDLETIGRSIPLWRTDFAVYSREKDNKEVAGQCHTYGLSFWVPLNASGGFVRINNYAFRSWMSSGLGIRLEGEGDAPQAVIPDDFPFDTLGKQVRQYKSIRKYYEGDYYPLTEYSQAEDAWMVYQFDRPDLNEGMIVALKRSNSPFPKAVFSLHGLNPDAEYQLTNLDDDSRTAVKGSLLLNKGLEIELPDNPDSALISYRLAGPDTPEVNPE